MMKRLLFTLLFIFGLYGYALAQREVSGRVTDAKGGGIPGASVLIKGTTNGISTDLEGNFKLKVNSDLDVLVFSGVGLSTKEMVVGSQSSFDVKLEDEVTVLDGNVVINGYREFTREEAVSTVATIDKKAIEQIPVGSFDQMLQGRAAGLQMNSSSGQPGDAGRIRIRGVGSLTSILNTSATNLNVSDTFGPLYIMDGVAISPEAFATYNPNDFERLDVLKDAPAVSQYGSRGANGVIVITTKRGKKNQKALVTYRGQFGYTTLTRGRSSFGLMNSQEKVAFERFAFGEGIPLGIAGGILASPTGTTAQKEAAIAQFANTDADWTKFIFRVGRMQSHEVNVQGGTEKTRYYISGGFRREDGVVPNSTLDRYTLRFNLDQEVNKNLNVGLSSTIGYTTNQRPRDQGEEGDQGSVTTANPVVQAILANPYYSPLDPNRPDRGGYSAPYTFAGTPFTGPQPNGSLNFNTNFLRQQQFEFVGRGQTKVTMSAYAEYKLPLKGLSIRSNVGIDHLNNVSMTYVAPNAEAPSAANGLGFVTRGYLRQNVTTFTTMLKYATEFGKNKEHRISAILANEFVKRKFFSFSSQGQGLSTILPFPTPTAGNATFFPAIAAQESFNNLIGFFTDISYSYGGRYNLSVGARRDGSSRFGADKRFGTFYSVGASWNIHNENFFKGIEKVVSTAMVRVNYGIVGNQELGEGTAGRQAGNFRYLPIFANATSYGGTPGLAPSVLPNPGLSWEQTANFGVGADFGFFKNRLMLTIDYYNRQTKDLLLSKAVSYTTGFTSQTINGGGIRNRGIEIALKATIIDSDNFTWRTDFNYTYNQNKITDLAGNERIIARDGSALQTGYPVQTHFLVRWAGVDPQTGDGQYLNKDGVRTSNQDPNDAVMLTQSIAPYYGGFNNSFIINKYFEIGVFFTYSGGNQMINNIDGFTRYVSYGSAPIDNSNKDRSMINAWTTPGQNTDVPRLDWLNQVNDTRFLYDASFIRLKNVTVAYNIPGSILKGKLSSVRIYAQAQNLLTFTNYRGFEPENTSAEDSFNFPTPRVINMGVDVTF